MFRVISKVVLKWCHLWIRLQTRKMGVLIYESRDLELTF